MSDPHVCQCKYCGRQLNPPMVYMVPAPTPPSCEHEWKGTGVWQSTTGDHGSRICIKCQLYQQW